MSADNLTDFLNIGKKAKRQISSNVAALSTDQLLAMCNLNKIDINDIPTGCIAGINYFCQGKSDLSQCQQWYDSVFSNSIYAPIGANCPAWKSGPRSSNCQNAVNSINVKLDYTIVNKQFASWFANVLFADRVYAPCNKNCNWD